jgi:hypothetical protein
MGMVYCHVVSLIVPASCTPPIIVGNMASPTFCMAIPNIIPYHDGYNELSHRLSNDHIIPVTRPYAVPTIRFGTTRATIGHKHAEPSEYAEPIQNKAIVRVSPITLKVAHV